MNKLESSDKIQQKTSSKVVSNLVFIFVLAIVFINVIPVIFPALMVRLVSQYDSVINTFEFGSLAFPLLSSNVLLFGLGFLYYKKNLPNVFLKSIEFIRDFEISARTTLIVIVVLLCLFIVSNLNQLFIDESTQFPDYSQILAPALKYWLTSKPNLGIDATEYIHRHVEMFLLTASVTLFKNIKIIPFLASISLLILTYFTAAKMSKKRFAGVISMFVLLQTYTFQRYSTIAVYDNFWILFYLLSIYVLYNKWYLSAFSYVLSIFSKLLSAPFLLMTLFFIYNSDISKDKRILIISSYVIAVIVSILIIIFQGNIYTSFISQKPDISMLLNGFAVWANEERFDTFLILSILPVVIGLFFTAKRGIQEANSILIMFAGMFLEGPVFQMINPAAMEPYRFITLVVFFAIGIGVILSKRTR